MNLLKEIAQDLINRFGTDLRNVTVVLPGKRARLFLNQYLAEINGKPIWTPRYQTIDELVMQLSPYRKAETITSVCLLYDIYAQLLKDEAKPLDEFYAWGEIILSDFDDIDKHMAPAEKIFQNARDLHDISTDYLEKEQIEALREFFANFSVESQTEIKKNFLRLWTIMPELYSQLRERLAAKGLLYPGALYRDVATRLNHVNAGAHSSLLPPHSSLLTPPSSLLTSPSSLLTPHFSLLTPKYCFVGFNILDESTEALFRYYQQEYHALFYWDYDELYCKDKDWEAGLFINQDRRIFPNALSEEHFDNLRHLKDITFIATSTNNAQSRYIPEWLKDHLTEIENETAVVLADEHQLGSVLHCIPEYPTKEELEAKKIDTTGLPKDINITMGYPLSDTPVYSFINTLLSLYIDGYDNSTKEYRYTFLQRLKHHPFSCYLQPDMLEAKPLEVIELLLRLQQALKQVSYHFSQKEERTIYDQLYIEALFKTHVILTQFLQLMEPDEQDSTLSLSLSTLSLSTLRRLLRQVLMATSIPFHGEPAVGLQVMGLLETRNIDFRNLLMLSVGEGILPKKNDDTSLIPYNLREAFGLTTMRHRISVFAYYFYRLISRAEHVTLMYNENSSGLSSNEMSRFMRQLMAETNLPIRHIRLIPKNEDRPAELPTEVTKTQEMVDDLKAKYINNQHHRLSPTAINTYLNCTLQFYFKYIAGLSVTEELEDGIDAALFGTIFHDSANLFYRQMQKHYGTSTINAAMLQQALENPQLHIHPFVSISLILNVFSAKKTDDHRKQDEEKERRMQQYELLTTQQLRAEVDNYFSQQAHSMMLTGLNRIIADVICQYLEQLVKYDLAHAPFTLVGLEVDKYFQLELNPREIITTGGRIDRLEMDSEQHLTVVDYKTGGRPGTVKDVETMFLHKNKQDGYYLQTFIYALAVQQEKHDTVIPTLFYVNHNGQPNDYDRNLYLGTSKVQERVEDIAFYAEEFTTKLRDTISELFDINSKFEPTDKTAACQYCDFASICSRRAINLEEQNN